MSIYIKSVSSQEDNLLDKFITLKNGKNIFANTKEASITLELKNDNKLYIFGDIFYHLTDNGEIKLIDSNSKGYLSKLFSESSLKEVIESLEGQYIGLLVDMKTGVLQLFCDRYSRLDTFYFVADGDFYFATDLDFIFKYTKPEYNQKMLAHLFSVYGWYTPKGLTIYENVKQLKVGEIMTLSDRGIESELIDFKPLDIEDYGDEKLEIYYKILRESVIARANKNGKTWVSSSSGWDSTMLTSLLVDELDPKNVGMLVGSMHYSDKVEVINKFEINKIEKIGKFFGIVPEIVEFDFKSSKASDLWIKVLPYYRSKHMYSYTTYSFNKLSDRLKNLAGSTTILNGETADSFHNFGFSQFVTFFHTVKSFTEYADKMNCYLYGPTFFKKALDGSFHKDKVFQIFKKLNENSDFSLDISKTEDVIESYLFPIFYGSPRIPFARTYRNPALTSKGQQSIYHFPFREYMPEVLSTISEKNIYSWIIYLYHSFHSQGSTVNTQKHAMELNGHKWGMPFNDIRLIDFLSRAPEKWGRGLELNNTKFPLKWVARNKIKFPYELLSEGPHSYLYDVIEGFSLMAEITYRSGVTEFFKDKLKDRTYRDILNNEYFDLNYLDGLVTDFLNGKEAVGSDFNNLSSLITLSVTEWY